MAHFYKLMNRGAYSTSSHRVNRAQDAIFGSSSSKSGVASTLNKLVLSHSLPDHSSQGAIMSATDAAPLASQSAKTQDVITATTKPPISQVISSSIKVTSKHEVNPFDQTSAERVFNKMFQYALQPTKIVPYFYRSTETQDPAGIAIVTLITIERLAVFDNLVNHFMGPISVTLHINDDEHKLKSLEALHDLHQSNPNFRRFVDVHLVIDKFERQFNMWRNIARFFARSELVMALDVDFMLCSDLRANFAKLSTKNKAMLREGRAVFVVPAFEYTKDSAEVDVDTYPSDKKELLEKIHSHDLSMFHQRWKRGHGPTDYAKWYTEKEPYRITEYNYNYEPYVLMKRDGLPWCDERFVGYGANKAACLYEIFLSGAEFWTLPEDFLIHQRHPYPENDRRVEV